jgi:hypothetical protein
MRVTVYDKNPGEGFWQKFLMTSWLVGCWLQKLLGRLDAYYGASSWEDAVEWLSSRGAMTSIQYWGHGSPGLVYLGGVASNGAHLLSKPLLVTPETVIWFRTCSTFQGVGGHGFAKKVADGLNCTVAAHTRVVGPLQGGLHTHKPHSEPSWPTTEGELPTSWVPCWLRWGNNTVTCLSMKIPAGW